jgi:hypothetical protein
VTKSYEHPAHWRNTGGRGAADRLKGHMTATSSGGYLMGRPAPAGGEGPKVPSGVPNGTSCQGRIGREPPGAVRAFAGCLAALGGRVPIAVSFAVFAVVRLGLAVPVTPGGVGVAEAGYAAALVAAGAAAEPAVAATLLFRAASYLLPIPLGLGCWVAWRRRTGRTALLPARPGEHPRRHDHVRDADRRPVPAHRTR